MSFEIGVVLVVLLAAVVLFVSEKIAVDLVALLVMATLVASGILTAEEGIRGFANPATVTVAAMFVLSAGVFATGTMEGIGRQLARLGRYQPALAVLTLMLGIGTVSAFINNTAAVAISLPIVLTMARDTDTSPSKLLIPLSFAAIFGGTCTLIGTSTNILTSSIAEGHGLPPFRMFELAPFGLVVFVVGTLYMTTIGTRLLPERKRASDLPGAFELNDYLTEIVILPEAASVGAQLSSSPLVRSAQMTVLEIVRGTERIHLPRGDTVIMAGDVLRAHCAADKIQALQDREGITIRHRVPWHSDSSRAEKLALIEVVLSPNSQYAGKTPDELEFRDTLGATILAIRHHGELLRDHLGATPLRPGDALLVEVVRTDLPRFKRDRGFVVISEIQHPVLRRRQAIPAVAIVVGVIVAVATGLLPVVSAAVLGCVLMVVVGCLNLEAAYQAIDWKVIFLMAGVLSLGTALEKTGAANLIADSLITFVGPWGPIAVVSVLYLLTSVLTEVMSNVATAALLVPIAIASAEGLGCDSRPFLMAVAFAASASFMTPVGYQTNTLVYGPGGYRFADFVRVGAPLNLIFWILASLLIPVFWPF